MSERGRPAKFKPSYVEQARELCELGATDLELAEFFDVEVRTIYRWKNEHEDFCQAVKVGKWAADDRVERSLYQRAVGYSFESEKIFHFQGHITRAPCVEHVPPDPSAAFNSERDVNVNASVDLLRAIEEGNKRAASGG
jgi:hypothetical protein